MAARDRPARVARNGVGSGLLLLLLAARLAGPVLSAGCPVVCHCRWKGGKKTVECVDRQLKALPSSADADTQVLDVSGHALTGLAERAFQRHGLLALQRVFVSRGRLETIGQHAFSGLTNLVELDLRENRLTSVPGAALRDVPALRRLSLSGNPLQRVHRGDLGALRELTSLELARCQLRTVESGAFATLLRLEWLQLQENQLTTLAAVDLSLHLHGIQLQGNRWLCDCRLRELRHWLHQYPVPLTVPPRCSAPSRLAGRAVHNTSAAELACAPDIRPTDRLLEVSLNSSVVLSCAAQADPAAELSWSFNGRRLQDGGDGGGEDGFFITESSESGEGGEGGGEGTVRRSQLVIPSAAEEDHGVFRCRAANAAGVSTAEYTVRVLLPPDTRSSGTAPTSRSHLALPVGGSLVLVAASALLLIGALAVRRGRRLRRGRKFSVSREPVSGEGAASPGVGGGAASRPLSRDTTLTDCHDHQLQELPRHPPRCSRECGPDVLSDAGVAVTVERDPPPPPPLEPGVRVIQDLSWPPAWTLNPTLSASHGNIYGEPLIRRGSVSTGSYHQYLCDAPAGAGTERGRPPLGWRSLPRPARPRPPPPAAGGSPERWRRSGLSASQYIAGAPQFVSGPPQLVAVDPARVCSCMLGPSLEGRLWRLPVCHPAAVTAVAAVPAPPPPPWPVRTRCGAPARPRCRCVTPGSGPPVSAVSAVSGVSGMCPSVPTVSTPLAPPAGFGDEPPPPPPPPSGPVKCGGARWVAHGGREQFGMAAVAAVAGHVLAAEVPADSPDEGYVEAVPDA